MGATVDPKTKATGPVIAIGWTGAKDDGTHQPVQRSGVRVVIVAMKPGNSGGAKGHSERDS